MILFQIKRNNWKKEGCDSFDYFNMLLSLIVIIFDKTTHWLWNLKRKIQTPLKNQQKNLSLNLNYSSSIKLSSPLKKKHTTPFKKQFKSKTLNQVLAPPEILSPKYLAPKKCKNTIYHLSQVPAKIQSVRATEKR